MVHARTLVVAMFGVSAALGVLQAYVLALHQDLRIVSFVSIFAFAPLLFAWCKADAAGRAITPPPAAPLLVALVALIGVPYYFLKSLPLKQAALSIARAAVLFLLMMTTSAVLAAVASYVFAS